MITHVNVGNEHEIDRDLLSLKQSVKHPSSLSQIFYCLNEHGKLFFPSFTQKLNAAVIAVVLVPSFSSAFKSVKRL